MQQTPNYALKKIELIDSPPDITVINPNWDKIDTELKKNADAVTTHLADDVSHNRYGTAAGTNAKTITLNPAPTALVAGLSLRFKNTTANTGAVTLNVNSLGAKPIVKNGGIALSSGNLKVGGVYTVLFDGTNFILQGEGGSGNALASDLLSGKTATTDAGDIVGNMPNRGMFNLPLGAIVPNGYYSGGIVPNGKKYEGGGIAIPINSWVNVVTDFVPEILRAKNSIHWVLGTQVDSTRSFITKYPENGSVNLDFTWNQKNFNVGNFGGGSSFVDYIAYER